MMQSEWNMMPMTDDHVEQVAELEKICFSDPWSLNSVASELHNPLSLWLVVTDGETVAGYVGSQTVLDETDILNVAVHPHYRRQGIAEALLTALETNVKEKNVVQITLEVRDSNEPAIRLYEGLGYAQVGLRKNYYFKPKEDARILRKKL